MDTNNENPNLNNENGNPENPGNSQPKEGVVEWLKRKRRQFIVWTETTRTGRTVVRVKRAGKTLLAGYGAWKLVENLRKPKDEVVVLTEGEINVDDPAEEPAEEDLPAETGDEITEEE